METAKPKLKLWYDKVAACPLREVKSVRDTIQLYEDEILNYFINRQTNASSESFNSKVKGLHNQVEGVLDTPFFMYGWRQFLDRVFRGGNPLGLSGAP